MKNLSKIFIHLYRLKTKQAVVSGHFLRNQRLLLPFLLEKSAKTAQRLQQQTEVAYAEIYAKKLLDQIDALQKAIQKIRKNKKS